jgi:hypothetical protein
MQSNLTDSDIAIGVLPPHGLNTLSSVACTGDLNEDRTALLNVVTRIMAANGEVLLKADGCFVDRIQIRPFDASQYPHEVFKLGAFQIMTGIEDTTYAEMLENVLIDSLGLRGVPQQVRLEVRSERNH